jgi:branched-chain amino acid transport system substrate-binding protein
VFHDALPARTRALAITFALAAITIAACSPPPPPRPENNAEIKQPPATAALPSTSAPGPEAPPSQPRPETLKIGAYLSLSGAEAELGGDAREGIDLALAEVNAAGGVKGRPIEVLYADDASNPQKAAEVVLRLIDQDNVIALLGEVSSARSKAGGVVANRKGVPMLTPSATHQAVTEVGPFIFRACVIDDVQGRAAARFFLDALPGKKKRTGVLFAKEDVYSETLADAFRAEAHRLDIDVVVDKGFARSEKDFSPYLKEIAKNKLTLVYVPVYYNTMALIAQQAQEAKIQPSALFGGDGWHAATFLDSSGKLMEGARFTTPWIADAPWPKSRAFLASYQAKFKREPSAVAATSYDAAGILAGAIGRAKADTREAVRDALGETKGFVGATGTISLNSARNAEKQIIVAQIKGGRFTYATTLEMPPGVD